MTPSAEPSVIPGLDRVSGVLFVDEDTQIRNIESAIRRHLPQVWTVAPRGDLVAIVGSGPSLHETKDELIEVVRRGAKVVALNGAYQWCLEQNFVPNAQIVMDPRPSNARFVTPALPLCRYYVASQCDPAVFDAVADREFVAIWHAVNAVPPTPEARAAATPHEARMQAVLNAFYLGHWTGISGGTTVFTRALLLLRTLGYLRFEVFGVDSCWRGDQHHAVRQPENDTDRRLIVTCGPTAGPIREFVCAPWMVKQAEDLVEVLRSVGHLFTLRIHGDGLLAYMLSSVADLHVSVEE